MKEELIVLSDYLDKIGRHKEANEIDGLLVKVATDYSEAAAQTGLSSAALRAITELLLRVSRKPECIQQLNALSADNNISEEELIQLIDQGCFRQDESGLSAEYAERAQDTVSSINWIQQNKVKAAFLFGLTTVMLGWAIPKLIDWIREKLMASRAKKIKRIQQGMYATPKTQDGPQTFVQQSNPEQRDLTQKELRALQGSNTDKYLAAIDKGDIDYVDIIITHNHASAATEKKEVYLEGVKVGLKTKSCGEVITEVNYSDASTLFSDYIINFEEKKIIKLYFNNNFYQHPNVVYSLNQCPSFKGFGKEVVIPRLINAVFFMKGFGRFEIPLKFIDGQEVYRANTYAGGFL